MEPGEDAVELGAGQGAGEAQAPNAQGPRLYPGDTGLLPEAARRALVQLLSGPSLEHQRHRDSGRRCCSTRTRSAPGSRTYFST